MFELCRATPDEVRRTLPGDEVIAHPIGSATHAITIHVPPDQVWPWLVQMDCDRAGWYSYDFLDNGGKPSATTIIPALQQLAVGDVMPAAPGDRESFVVIDFTPYKMLLLGVPAVNTAGDSRESTHASAQASRGSWVYVLEETQAHHTRLITRACLGDVPLPSPKSGKPFLARFATPSEFLEPIILKFPRPVMAFLMRLVHFIMQQRQLVGIKQRAEREALARSSSAEEGRAAGIVAR